MLALPRIAFGAAALLLPLAAPLMASAQPVPIQTFKDWTKSCEKAQGTSPAICYVEQRVSRSDSPKSLILAVAIGPFAERNQLAMIIKLPPDTVQASGIGLKIDDNKARQAQINICTDQDCTVGGIIDDALLKELRAGKRAIISYTDSKKSQLDIPVSLAGLATGLKALSGR